MKKKTSKKEAVTHKSIEVNGNNLFYSGSTPVIPVDQSGLYSLKDLAPLGRVTIATECKKGLVINPLFDLEILTDRYSIAHFSYDVSLFIDTNIRKLLENALVKFISSQSDCKIDYVDFAEEDPTFRYSQLIESSELSEIIAKAMFIHF